MVGLVEKIFGFFFRFFIWFFPALAPPIPRRPHLVVFNHHEGLTHGVPHRVLVGDDQLVAGFVQVLGHFLGKGEEEGEGEEEASVCQLRRIVPVNTQFFVF